MKKNKEIDFLDFVILYVCVCAICNFAGSMHEPVHIMTGLFEAFDI